MSLQAIPYILLLGLLFGSTLIASRYGVGQLAPLTYVGLRLTLASLGHIFVYLFAIGGQKWPTNRTLWRRAAFLGIFDTAIPMSMIVSSLQFQSSGLTAIVATIGPAVTVLTAHFFLPDEPLTRRKSLGVTLALGGALLLALLGESGLPDLGRANPIGILLAMTCISSASAMAVYARKQVSEFDSFQVASVRMFTAALIVMPLSIVLVGFDLGRVNWQGYLALGYAAIAGTFFAFWLVIYSISRFGATQTAMTNYVAPVIASLGGVLLLGEHFTSGMIGGTVLIMAGIAILNGHGKSLTGRVPHDAPLS